MKDNERLIYLLKVANNLLNKQNKSPYVLNMLAETVFYDGCECDGGCLLDDIEAELELYEIYKDDDGDYNLTN